ncbi:class I SAM-dependent methyltransferase [Nocardia panacis]|uniref:class I SAM-dependent methyltransferase n=1 Tax=Nocardia panacis TaxID=2340916 RepID=UPI0011C484FC|nr:class I SAM-dependent methyltransferase [Nocardia panacis]
MSFTAETMALQRALESARPEGTRLFTDPFAVSFLSRPLWLAAEVARVPVVGGLVARLYDAVVSGPRASAVAGTKLIDDTVVEAVRDGVGRVVLLGDGFDSRAWRLAELPGSRGGGSGSAGTQEAKVAAVRGVEPVGELRFLPVDFEVDDLEMSLRAAGLGASAS